MKYRAVMVLLLLLTACGGGTAARTPDGIVAAFKAAGLEAENTKVMEAADYGPAPKGTEQGVRFIIPSLDSDSGGRIFVGKTAADLEGLRTYYSELAKMGGMFFSHVFSKDNMLVQINGELPQEQAAKYDAALQAIK